MIRYFICSIAELILYFLQHSPGSAEPVVSNEFAASRTKADQARLLDAIVSVRAKKSRFSKASLEH